MLARDNEKPSGLEIYGTLYKWKPQGLPGSPIGQFRRIESILAKLQDAESRNRESQDRRVASWEHWVPLPDHEAHKAKEAEEDHTADESYEYDDERQLIPTRTKSFDLWNDQ